MKKGIDRFFVGSCFVLSLFLSGCFQSKFEKVGQIHSGKVEIFQLGLSWSNVFLVRGEHSFLVDSGSAKDWDPLEGALSDFGVKVNDLSAVILTHGHADHAGLASKFSKLGVPVIAGKGDSDMLLRGRNNPLASTNITAQLLKLLVDTPFEPVEGAELIQAEKDLSVQIGESFKVVPTPGHTPGSLVVIVGTNQAIVGDMMLGGIMGGALFGDHPGEHYYQDDLKKNHENIKALLDLGVERFYLGHGGPVSAESVKEWIASVQ